MHQEIPKILDDLAGEVVDAALKVHRASCPGLLESAYQACLEIEFKKRGLRYCSQYELPVRYEGIVTDGAYRIDLLVSDQLIVEIKAVKQLLRVYSAQLLTYLCLAGKRLDGDQGGVARGRSNLPGIDRVMDTCRSGIDLVAKCLAGRPNG